MADKTKDQFRTRVAGIGAGSSGRYPCSISSEAPIKSYDERGAYWEVLSHDPSALNLERAPLPLIECHDLSHVNIGVIESLHAEGGKLRGMLVLGASERAQELARDLDSGIVTGLSVGYLINTSVESRGPGGERVVTATRWTPHECSLTGVPADINVGIGRSLVVPPEVLQVNAVPTRGDEPQTPGVTMTDDEIKAEKLKAAAEAVQAERARAQGIRSACEKLGQRDLADTLINEGLSLDAARARVIDAHAERTAKVVSAPSGIEVGKEASEKSAEQLTGWMIEKAGATELVARARGLKGLSPVHARMLAGADADGGDARGSSLLDLARGALETKGVNTRGLNSTEIAKRALSARFGQRDIGPVTPSSDFSVLYENVMHKILLASYLTQETTWQRVCKSDTVSDVLRPSSRYRVGSFGTLDVSPEGAEIQHKVIPDGNKFSLYTQKYANIIGLSAEAIINDDMGANADIATRFGASYKLTLEKAFYALLAENSGMGPTMSDSLPFFHASRSNIGTGAALSIASLDADRLQMKRQLDISGQEYLELSPSVLLVPTELSTAARQYNLMQYSDVASKFQVPNAVQGLFRDIVDTPRLSGTRRYTFADIASAPAFVVAFLEGKGQAPSLEMREGWSTDGVEWRVKLYAKVQAFDPKGAMTNAGA
jgi:hypothetical protein